MEYIILNKITNIIDNIGHERMEKYYLYFNIMNFVIACLYILFMCIIGTIYVIQMLF